jgi:cytidylate kinase
MQIRQDIVDELFGLRPASWTMIQQTSETILKLTELGNAILIGRGGNVITAKRPNVFHVRLVAPLATRIDQVARTNGLNQRAARDFCRREDEGRRRYLWKYFKSDIDDPLLYHLCINTDLVSFAEAARLIAEGVQGQGASVGGGMSKAGMAHTNAACAHRAELQYMQLERL